MAKAKYERRKPHVNIGTIGHVDHGKTTLTSALTKVCAERGLGKFVSYDEVAKASVSQGRRDATKILTIAIAHVGDEIPVIVGAATKALEGDTSPLGVPAIMKLLDAVDSYIPTPVRAVDKPFLMPIEDVFTISGRGTVVTGRCERGIVKVGDEVEIVGLRPTQSTVVTGVEMFRKVLDEGQAGDNIGVLLRGTKKEEVERGMVLAKPKTITPHTKFKAEVYVLTKEEGGRHTPFFNGYRPQFYFRTTDVTGVVALPAGGQRGDHGGVDLADRDGPGAALCDPRGRQDRRLRHRHRHPGVREGAEEGYGNQARSADPHPAQEL